MRKSGIAKHLLFWLVFFCVSLFNDLYLSASFTSHPEWQLFFQSSLSIFCLYAVKVIVVYVFLLKIIPGWIENKKRNFYLLIGLLCLFGGAILMRIVTQQIIWKLIYKSPAPELTFYQVSARYLYSLLDLLQITAIASAVKLYFNRIRSLEHEKKLEHEKLQAEMQHLRSQTNPHFLFNTLNSIYALTRVKSDKAPEAVLQLSKILRYILYETSLPTKLLSDEINVIDNYIQLQQMRFEDRIKINFEKNVSSAKIHIAPLLILPLVENAYKHCHTIDALINIKLDANDDKLKLTISNPVGESSMPTEEHHGIGMGSIQRQLQLLYGKFKFTHTTEQAQFIVNLEIDLNTYAKTELFDTGG